MDNTIIAALRNIINRFVMDVGSFPKAIVLARNDFDILLTELGNKVEYVAVPHNHNKRGVLVDGVRIDWEN